MNIKNTYKKIYSSKLYTLFVVVLSLVIVGVLFINYSNQAQAASPTVTTPTVTSITSTGATLGASVTSSGGFSITVRGTCWGTTAAPTTNCLAEGGTGTGALTALGTPTIATTNPAGITISADGTSVYVVNINSATISMYSRNTGTGALTALGTPTIAAGTNPTGIAISSDGTSVYVANQGSNTISMYSRNTGTGALTALGTPTIATGTTPLGITISADGTSVYATNWGSATISMYSRNTGTGALTALGTPTIATGTNPQGITISADGTSVYAVNNGSATVSMYSRNTGTGALTALGTPTIATGTGPRGIAISADGTSAYVANSGSATVSMYSRNTGTGALTALGTPTIATGTGPFSVTISADGTSVYATNSTSNTISMYSRNTGTGALTALGTPTIATGTYPYGITISADGTSVYVTGYSSSAISMYSRDTGTGVFTHARTGLPSNTLIYYRGYATNSEGTAYSVDGSFTTPAAAPVGTLTGTAVTVKVGELKTLPNLTATDSGGEILAANDVFIKIPAGVNAVFDQTVTGVATGLTMTPSGTITVNPTITYLDSKTVHIDITANATTTNTLLISGLKIIGNTSNTVAAALTWSVNDVTGGGAYGAGDANTNITVNGSNDVVTPTTTPTNTGVSVAGVSYTVNFTLPTGGVITPNGIITLTFPTSFNVSAATISTTHPGMDGTFAAIGIVGQVLTLTRTGGGTNAVAGQVAVTIDGVTNINVINSNYVIGVATSLSTGASAILSNSVNTAAFQVAPIAITDLSCASSGSAGAVWLRWTSPTGVTAGYEARTSLANITSGNYASATIFTQSPTWVSGTVGAAQQQLVTSLTPNNLYFFNVEALGANTTNSMISNTVYCTVPAGARSVIDSTAPTTSVTSPAMNSTVSVNEPLVIKGSSIDIGGSSVQFVEVSLDNGTTWNRADITVAEDGNRLWQYTWARPSAGSQKILVRATDWVGNTETPDVSVSITVATTVPTTTTTTTTTTGLPYVAPVGATQIQANITYLQGQLVVLLQQLLASLQAQLAGQ